MQKKVPIRLNAPKAIFALIFNLNLINNQELTVAG